MSEISSFEVISLAITISSVLISASSFLLGFYLSGWKNGVESEKLKHYKISLVSLLIPTLIITPLSLAYLNFNDLSNFDYFQIFAGVVSLIPAVVFLIILIIKR